MKAREVADVFEAIVPISLGIASDIENNFLGFRVGDPDIDVTGLGMCWWMSEEVIDAAIEKGLNFLISHEPELFRWYESPWHTNLRPEVIEFNKRKKKKLEDNGMCVYTAHSNWDAQAEVGMGPGLAKVLGFTDMIRRDVIIGVYRVGPMTFAELIEHVKERMGLAHVRVQGDPEKRIETVVLGWGSMGSEVEAILANGADADSASRSERQQLGQSRPFEEVMEMNVRKLKKRYPDKFTQESALNRDLESERKAAD